MQSWKPQAGTQISSLQEGLFNGGNGTNGNEWEWSVLALTDGLSEYANTFL